MELPADPTAGRYLEQLSDSDLGLLATVSGLTPAASADEAAPYLRSHPELVEAALGDPALFEALFRPELAVHGVRAEVSPFLLFAVAVHRGVFDLQSATFVAERFGGHRRIPVFDTASMRRYYTDPAHRLFAVEHLASYTRVQSGPVWVRRGERWRRQRFSELEPHRLAAVLEAVSEEERPGLFRRLGDLALFLTGVFPDHAATRPAHPIEIERLLRTLRLDPGTPFTAAEAAELLAAAGSSRATLLTALGPRWYRLAAAGTPLPTTRALLLDAADGFDVARRFLTLVTDRYLFPLRDGFFGAAAG
jgi:hypothetical protein